MQAKRIQVNESNNGAGAQTNVFLQVPTTPREEANFHNIWASFSAEPQDADANSQGTWLIILQPQAQTVTPTFTDAVVNGESNNAIIVACGVYSASNQSPWTHSIQVKTSRNLRPGDALAAILVTTGITAGVSSNRVMLCAHTIRK